MLVDGATVALGVAVTGGYRSPLLFLVFLDVMAVTLVASYRTGLKLAVWCALLLLLAHAAADAGVVEGTNVLDDRVAIVSAVAFLLFAVCAALFSAVNERALRNSRGHLEQLVDLGAELERAIRPDDVLATLVRHSCARLGFTRAVVLVRSGPVWDGVRDDGTIEVQFHVVGPTGAADRGGVVVGRVDARAGGRRRSARPRVPRRQQRRDHPDHRRRRAPRGRGR